MGNTSQTPEILLNDGNITQISYYINDNKMIEIKDDLKIEDALKTESSFFNSFFVDFFTEKDMLKLAYVLEKEDLDKITEVLGKDGRIEIGELEKYIPKKYIPVIYLKNFFTNFFKGSSKIGELIENIKEEKISKDKLLTKGTYGEIYVDETEKKVIKKVRYLDEKREYTEDQIYTLDVNFCLENIATIMLYCMHSKMIDFLGRTFPQPFLKIELSTYKENQSDTLKKPFTISERLDMDCQQFFKETQDTLKQANMIGCISYLLLYLQSAIDFVHGDFHSRNVMLRREKINGKNWNGFESEYRPFIIDLGATCADLTKCCELSSFYVRSFYGSTQYCQNKSHDMRLFIWSILPFLTPKLKEIFYPEFNKYYKKSGDKIHGEGYFHYLTDTNDEFLPQNVIKTIEKNLAESATPRASTVAESKKRKEEKISKRETPSTTPQCEQTIQRAKTIQYSASTQRASTTQRVKTTQPTPIRRTSTRK
jgi:hypothetical protein